MNHFTVTDRQFNIENLVSQFKVKSYDKSYGVEIVSKNLQNILKEIYNENDYIIADEFFKSKIQHFKSVFVTATEENKTMEKVLEILDILQYNKFSKKNKLIVLGGGILQDIGGLVSGLYKRGVCWFLIPTTMLAITDSCIGGKVGVNRNSKNAIGMFYSPNQVIISDNFLETLNNDMIISGLGESLKLAAIAGLNEVNRFKFFLQKNDKKSIILQSLAIKKVIIEIDELEKCERKVLNYGHTVGHAIESSCEYFIPHGIAVLFGMYLVNRLFEKTKNFKEFNDYILSLIPLKYFIKFDTREIIKHMENDKKNIGDQICFIVLEDYGKSNFVYKSKEDVYPILNSIIDDLNIKPI